MTRASSLVAAQSSRWAGIDPWLPPAPPPPDGHPITAALPGGERVAGVLVRASLSPGTLPTLWSALETWELHPLLGEHPRAGMHALLSRWRDLMDRAPLTGDSACLVSWPSRDAEAAGPLLEHGFVPLSMIAVRRASEPEPAPVPPGVRIRRAGPEDLEIATRLALAEVEYSAQVGSTVLRPDAAVLKQTSLRIRLDEGDPVWLAEQDGVPLGLVECWASVSEPGTWTGSRLPAGRWGYVNCLSVRQGARGAGVGRALMSVAHKEISDSGAIGSFLYYNPPNPLSTVFWARQGYRPLWTVWEVRPASALR